LIKTRHLIIGSDIALSISSVFMTGREAGPMGQALQREWNNDICTKLHMQTVVKTP
jgi:hypothetical protein